MQVILMERISNLGKLGDRVAVKSGYGRNYLIPKGKAVFATPTNIEKFEARRHELEAKAEARLAEAKVRAEKIQTLTLMHTAKASDEGKLFGSVGVRDIADIITKSGVDVAKSEVRMPDGPIRSTGEFNVEIQLHSDVILTVSVNIGAE